MLSRPGHGVPAFTQPKEALDALLRDPAQAALRRTFTVWIKSLLRRKAGSHSIADAGGGNAV